MKLRILIADDHDMVRETLAMFLGADGTVQTTAAHDLPEALAKMRSEGPFDLVLLDYSMPGMKGLDGLRTAIAAHGGNPVGLISGTASRLIADQALEMGAAGFLPKTMSDRERQVLRGLMHAQSNKEIARDLDLQEVTIKLHVKTLCRKLDAKNRTDAAMIARDAGFV